jgi:predicted PurR-regulated permease PerM
MTPSHDGSDRPDQTGAAHDPLVVQPHDQHEGPVARAEAVAAKMSTDDQPLGRPGPPLDRRSPFFVGMAGAAGVAVTYALVQVVLGTRDMLVLVGLALFLAAGLEPAVSWLVNRGLRRGLAVTIVLLVTIGALIGFLVAAVQPLIDQASQFVTHAPDYLRHVRDHSSLIGRLNDRLQLEQRLQGVFTQGQGTLVNGLLGAGMVVFDALTETVVVIVLTAYFLADLPRVRQAIYRLAPHSRRPRVILIGDQIFAKVGGYVLGNVLTSLIAGGGTFLWLIIFHVPYALLLALGVAVLDLIPVVGSTIAGIIVSLVAATVSLPVGIATAGYYVVYRLAEDYLIMPKIMGRVVEVPALITVVAVLIGGALLGLVGALVAIPAAAAVLLIFREVMAPRLDAT